MNDAPAMEMPRYKSHKEVWALKIKSINRTPSGYVMSVEDAGCAPILLNDEYMKKHLPAEGGYYVVYKDGYKSFSPAEAFEDGYTKM